MTREVLTGDETRICRYDPETKMQSAVCLFPDESPPPRTQKIAQRTEENGCLFLRKIGPRRHHSSLGQNVTAGCHVHHCRPKVFEVWCQRRQKTGPCGLFLHRDKTSTHSAATPVDFLNESEVQLLPYPPYSPDLSPCDFFLFPEVKKQLKGTLFESVEDACLSFTCLLYTSPSPRDAAQSRMPSSA